MLEQRGVVRFLWAKNMDAAKDIHKEMLPIWATFLCCIHIFNSAFKGLNTLSLRLSLNVSDQVSHP
jgi:hypothetical protein